MGQKQKSHIVPPSEHPTQSNHENRLNGWGTENPQNVTIGFDPQPFCILVPFLNAQLACFRMAFEHMVTSLLFSLVYGLLPHCTGNQMRKSSERQPQPIGGQPLLLQETFENFSQAGGALIFTIS